MTFLSFAEKRRITETAVFDSYGGNKADDIFICLISKWNIHVNFGCSRVVLKFGGLKLKNGKIAWNRKKVYIARYKYKYVPSLITETLLYL